jgi:hypothetical protein
MHRKILGIAVAAVALALVPATAGAFVAPQPNALTLGQDLLATGQTTALTGGATFAQQPLVSDPPSSAAPTSGEISGGGFLGFPTDGTNGVVLTTGDVNDVENADQGNENDSTWYDESYPHGDFANDVTTLRLDVTVPPTANCVSLDYRFLSEEYPEYVGSEYNDAFIAEIDTDDWNNDTPKAIFRPHDFAADPAGAPVSVNGVGPTAMLVSEATGTVFNAATGLVTTKQQITPGDHSLYFSIFDASDHILDSAVFLDNLRFINESSSTCKPPLAKDLTPPATPPAAPQPPSNTFTFGSKVVFGKGTTTVSMTVPAPGVITASDASTATTAAVARAEIAKKKKKKKPALIKNTKVVVTAAGTVKVKLSLTKAGKKALKKKHGKLKVKVKFSYTPTGGLPNSVTKSVLFKG